ncbi:MAG: sigma factor [Armatimonadota bacterium]
MGVVSSRNTLNPYAVSSVKQHARQLVRKPGFTAEDLPDVIQDLTIHLWEHLAQFDATRGKLTTFIDRVVAHKAADLLEARHAACRGCRLQVASLSDPISGDDGEGVCLEDLAEVDALRRQQGLREEAFERRVQLRVDLVRALARLSPDQVDLCRRLLGGATLSGIAADLGIPRGTLYESVYRIRAIFADAGLRGRL